MIKLDNRAISTPFVSLDIGDTFLGGDNKYYIKIQSVAKTKNFDVVGAYNAVCLTDGSLAYVDGSQPITIVEIEGVITCPR